MFPSHDRGEMTYRNFLVSGKVKDGRDKTSKIVFTDRFAGKSMSQKRRDMEAFKLMDGRDEDEEVHEVNPLPFARMQFLVTIDAERMLQRNDAFERAFKLETYDRALLNPLVQRDPEAMQKITRDFLFEPLMKGEAAQYLPKVSKVANALIPQRQNLQDCIYRSLCW